MAVKIIRGADHAPIDALTGKTVAVVGFGNQGHAHALNLRESGVAVVVANRPDTPNGRRAIAAGFSPMGIPEAVTGADLVILSLPDEAQPDVYSKAIAPHLEAGVTVGFLHGFNIRYGLIEPTGDVGVIMVAPKGPGATLRQLYLEGRGLPCLFAVHQDTPAGDAEAIGLAWANGIGSARAGIVYTTFAGETETDLFGEQAVLCGGMTELIRAAFEILCDAGYPPELAYLECCHEVKQVADLVYERGPAAMFEAISNTAEFGSYHAGPFLIDDAVRQRMRRILRDVRDGTFAAAMRADYKEGFPWFSGQRQRQRDHALEPAGQIVRSLMPWLADPDDGAS
ncbi:MAG: ketol-acid reductoisomerase [Planctomycetota bacterium]|jgi:ketol-acid reductoisomerase